VWEQGRVQGGGPNDWCMWEAKWSSMFRAEDTGGAEEGWGQPHTCTLRTRLDVTLYSLSRFFFLTPPPYFLLCGLPFPLQ
jgi:hypothetical protein